MWPTTADYELLAVTGDHQDQWATGQWVPGQCASRQFDKHRDKHHGNKQSRQLISQYFTNLTLIRHFKIKISRSPDDRLCSEALEAASKSMAKHSIAFWYLRSEFRFLFWLVCSIRDSYEQNYVDDWVSNAIALKVNLHQKWVTLTKFLFFCIKILLFNWQIALGAFMQALLFLLQKSLLSLIAQKSFGPKTANVPLAHCSGHFSLDSAFRWTSWQESLAQRVASSTKVTKISKFSHKLLSAELLFKLCPTLG